MLSYNYFHLNISIILPVKAEDPYNHLELLKQSLSDTQTSHIPLTSNFYNYISGTVLAGLPILFSGKESACQCRRHRFNPWVRKIPWRRKWQPIPAFLPRKPHGRRSLIGYSPWDRKELDTTEQLHFLSFPGSLAGKESACNAGDPTLIPESGRSPGEGISYPF